jgi:hypothetical protein
MRAGVAALALVLAGCGGSAETGSCREPDERYPERITKVADAIGRDGELVVVQGVLIGVGGVPDRICATLAQGSPPSCGGASLAVEGIRDLSAWESLHSEGDVTWSQGARVAGRVEGGAIRFELGCRTEEVREFVEDETGERLTLNPFQTNADVERIDLATLPAQVPADVRERFGSFSVGVRTVDSQQPLWSQELRNAPRGPDGVRWVRDSSGWLALKRYADDVAVVWWAGDERRLDERWRRLDRVFSQL